MSKPSQASLEKLFAAQLQFLATTLQPGTLVTYRAAVNRFLRFLHTFHPQVRHLSQLRRNPHILGWLRNLCEQDPPLANDTRGNYLVSLRRVLHDLASEHRYRLQEGLLVREDIPPADRYLPRPLASEDDRRLQDQLRKTDDLESNALLLMRATGIRIGECLNLATDCLRHLGEEQWAIHVSLGKLHTERWVPVDDEVRRILDRLVSLRSPTTSSSQVEPSPWLLPRTRCLQTSYYRIRRALTTAAQQAGCSAPLLPHQLRHSYATELLRAGVSLPALKELLGHKSLRMTLRYVQVSQNDLQREFHSARLKLAHSHPPLPLPLARLAPDASTGLPAASQALATSRHLLEMYRRQLPKGIARRTLDRLANRLTKIATTLETLFTGVK